jgi:SAM-dependent methyltransferase
MNVGKDDLLGRLAKTRDFTASLHAALSGAESVFEPGCGFGWNLLSLAQMPCPPKYLVGVEVNEKKIIDPRSAPAKQAGVSFWRADALEYLRTLEANSYDGVLMVDFVEHFTPEQGREILEHAKLIARKRVVLWGPMGSHPQDFDEWGTDGALWETHRWTMLPPDLEERGYACVAWDNYHGERNARGQARDRGAMWGIFDKGVQ